MWIEVCTFAPCCWVLVKLSYHREHSRGQSHPSLLTHTLVKDVCVVSATKLPWVLLSGVVLHRVLLSVWESTYLVTSGQRGSVPELPSVHFVFPIETWASAQLAAASTPASCCHSDCLSCVSQWQKSITSTKCLTWISVSQPHFYLDFCIEWFRWSSNFHVNISSIDKVFSDG